VCAFVYLLFFKKSGITIDFLFAFPNIFYLFGVVIKNLKRLFCCTIVIDKQIFLRGDKIS